MRRHWPMRMPGLAIRLLRSVLCAAMAAVALPTWAHFPSGYDLRAVHFERADGGLHAYIRLTLPLLAADGLGPVDAQGFAEAAPFTVRRIESAHAFYTPDVERIRAEPGAMAAWVARTHHVRLEGRQLVAEPRALRLYPKGMVPPFNTLEQARAATAPGDVVPAASADTDVAYVVVDTHLFYPGTGPAAGFEFAAPSRNAVLGQPEIQNLLVDHVDGRSFVYRRVGPLAEPVHMHPSAGAAARSFVAGGFEHVTGGLDHLLFVLCLALGAATLGSLLWRVTAFTVGHSLSLALGFFGMVPVAASWFIPAVETAIAASVVVAAASLLVRRAPQRMVGAVVAGVGLVHGLGFAFGLRELLDPQGGPHRLISLASFNLGVELGQVLFAAAVFGAGGWLAARSATLRHRAQWATAACCAVVAVAWTVERARGLLA